MMIKQENRAELLSVRALRKYYPVRRGFNPFRRGKRQFVRAVEDVSISILEGSTVAVVGESGCGKSTLARLITMLIPADSGQIVFDGQAVADGRANRKLLYRQMQMVFQDPESSLDPRIKIKDTVAEPLRRLADMDPEKIDELAMRSLEAVGLSQAQGERRPSQLSGGQKQRVAIARAIVVQPKLVILDEPTSALDASVQAQILTLLLSLQAEANLTYMLITHNIAVARYLSDTMYVMYSGNIVEYGPTESVVEAPYHPYTTFLIASAPIPNPWKRNILHIEIQGEVPSAINPPRGCRFHPRCPYAEKICSDAKPELREVAPGRIVACHFAETIRQSKEGKGTSEVDAPNP
jgi:peptide/nickel transport system ATP-binding protein